MHMFCRSPSVFLLRTLTFCFFHSCCATIHFTRSTTFLHKVTMDSGLGKALTHAVVVVVVARWVEKKMTLASVHTFKEFSQPMTFSCRHF